MPDTPLHQIPCTAPDVEGFEVICIRGKLSIDGQAHLPHETCGGTGYRFPSLGEDCPCLEWEPWTCSECSGHCPNHSLDCKTESCNGSGRTLVRTADALLDAGNQQGWVIGVWIYESSSGSQIWEAQVNHGKHWSGLTPADALEAAVLAAIAGGA